MEYQDSHLSRQELLLDVDGELSARDTARVREHLSACWKCRARRQELEGAITDFVRARERELETKLPPAARPRALLKAQLAQLATAGRSRRPYWPPFLRGLGWASGAAACVLMAVGLFFWNIAQRGTSRPQTAAIAIPDSRMTPGATVLLSRKEVCTETNAKNKAVPVALQRKVFEEYGIPHAEPRAYEVDYLVTPALGGADDIHNLWPQPYSAVWNAQMKDALEDRLRDMVCGGRLDLATAQQEIAGNWIAAYKKYFQTDKPLADHSKGRIQ
jgi:hypothetical protein